MPVTESRACRYHEYGCETPAWIRCDFENGTADFPGEGVMYLCQRHWYSMTPLGWAIGKPIVEGVLFRA